jgi:hypothetical protein
MPLAPHLHHVAGDLQPRHQRRQHRPRNAPGATRGAVSRALDRPPPRVADAVFLVIGDVGMAGAEGLRDLAIVLRPLVGVFDHQLDRRAGGLAFEHARQDADLVRFLALGGELVLAGLALVQPGLDVGLGQRHAGRAAVHRAADGRPVAFAPGGDAEKVAEGVQAHGALPWLGSGIPGRPPCHKPRKAKCTGKSAYFTGFFIEKALSIDNVFVISLIFGYFAIPRKYQYRALVWGIIGVIVLRGLMIASARRWCRTMPGCSTSSAPS